MLANDPERNAFEIRALLWRIDDAAGERRVNKGWTDTVPDAMCASSIAMAFVRPLPRVSRHAIDGAIRSSHMAHLG